MRLNIFLTSIFIFCFSIPTVRGFENFYGFLDIPFGVSKEGMVRLLILKHQFKQGGTKEVILKDQKPRILYPRDDDLVCRYKLGPSIVNLKFMFNDDQKFKAYMFYFNGVEKQEVSTLGKRNAFFLSRIFERKFGPAHSKNNPEDKPIETGKHAKLWEWALDDIKVYTGFRIKFGQVQALGYVERKGL